MLAEGPTTNPTVNMPVVSIVQVGLTISDTKSSDPVGLIAQLRTTVVLVNPPPEMLTVPQPGGAPCGDIKSGPTPVGVFAATFLNAANADEKVPPE